MTLKNLVGTVTWFLPIVWDSLFIIGPQTMKMELSLTDGKKFEAIPKTDHMFIGHEESEERKVGVNPKRFTFSYFNNMDFHTEFVRRFYKQMIFEGVQQIENELQ